MMVTLRCSCCALYGAERSWADVLICDDCLRWCDTTERVCVVRAAINASKRDAPLLYVPTEEDDSRA